MKPSISPRTRGIPLIRVRRHRAASVVLPTHRPSLLSHMTRWLLAGLVLGLAVLGLVTIIARTHASDAALERAHMQGMLVGQTMCGSR